MKRHYYIVLALIIAALLVIPTASVLLNENGTPKNIVETITEESKTSSVISQTSTTSSQSETTSTHSQEETTILKDQELYMKVGTKRIPRTAEEIFTEYNIDVRLNSHEKTQVTPLEDFFIMGSKIPDETEKYVKNPDEYKLTISGNVNNPTEFSYRSLLTEFEMKHMVTELYCMPHLTGIGKFSGPSLYEVINSSQPKDDATKVIVIAGDGYEQEFSLSEIKSHQEDYLLAVAMNGYPLAIEHGYPVRLALISKQGSQWVKWIVEIQIVDDNAT